jgi:RNA polymerase sigma-70 factor (ECF subfamily)
VVRNAAIDAGRSDRRRQSREASVAKPERWFVEPAIDGLDADQAVAALQGLPTEQREVIVARLWGGLTFEQFGRIAGCSASSAHRRFEAGIEELRKKLGASCPKTK